MMQRILILAGIAGAAVLAGIAPRLDGSPPASATQKMQWIGSSELQKDLELGSYRREADGISGQDHHLRNEP